MVLEKKDFANELYDAALILATLMGLSMISQKVFKSGLGVSTSSLNGAVKLAGGVAASAVLVKVAQGQTFLAKKIMD